MAEKRPLSNKRFAISYVLGMSVVGGIVMQGINVLIKALGFDMNSVYPLLNYGISFIVWFFSIWIGAIVVCWYLNNTFRIENKQKVLKSSVIFFIILYLILQGILAFLMLFDVLYLIYTVVQFFISASLIYFLGKKYIKAPSGQNVGVSETLGR